MAAITVGSTAVSLTSPAGGAVGAGWSSRQYRLAGASRAAATTVTVVSGLAGAAALATPVVLLWTTFRTVHTLAPGQVGALATAAVLLVQTVILWAAWAAWSSWRRRRPGERPEPVNQRRAASPTSPGEQIRGEVRAALTATRLLGRAAWRDATEASIASRMQDAACLFACSLALGATVNIIELALVYLGIQLARQIPLALGGLGVVEVALLSSLTSIGVPTAVGAAIVVVCRVISAWLLLPVGYTALLVLRRRPHTTDAGGQAGSPAAPTILHRPREKVSYERASTQPACRPGVDNASQQAGVSATAQLCRGPSRLPSRDC